MCHPPPPRHTRAHTHRHGGISRPRAPPQGLGAVNSLVGLVTGHPGTAAQSGPAGKAVRTVGWRPCEALTQPNPTPPCQRNAYVQATLGVGSVNFCTVDFGGVFFNSFYCVPCVLPDTSVLRCTKFIFCVKAALLAKGVVQATENDPNGDALHAMGHD